MVTSRQIVAVSGVGIAALLGAVVFYEHRATVEAKATAAANERQLETERAARRRACGLPTGGELREIRSIQGECQRVMLEEWKWPGSAVFPGMLDEDGPVESPDGCVSVYRSWMIAPDSAGQNRRQSYSCSYDPRTGVAKITLR